MAEADVRLAGRHRPMRRKDLRCFDRYHKSDQGHALLSGLAWIRCTSDSRTFSQLRQCRLVVVSTALSLAGFLSTDGSLFRSCPRLVLPSEENIWHTIFLSPVFVQGFAPDKLTPMLGVRGEPEPPITGYLKSWSSGGGLVAAVVRLWRAHQCDMDLARLYTPRGQK